jgi:hypothetical protein
MAEEEQFGLEENRVVATPQWRFGPFRLDLANARLW